MASATHKTFEECADAYIASHRAGWRNAKHAQQWKNTLATYTYPIFKDISVAHIDTGLVVNCLEPIWQSKTETASRLRGRIESVLDWATVRGYRKGENPARWKGHLDQLLPARSKVAKVKHHAALPYAKMSSFMKQLRAMDSVSALALEFVILTLTRTSETLHARWDEFDFKQQLLIIPASRMKAGVEHRVPLSDRAMDILKQLEKQKLGDYVFPGKRYGKPLSNMALLMTLRRMGAADETVHGFRSSFRDWAAETTNYPREVAEMTLAHTIENKVEAAYRRGDLFEKRRKLMEQWSRYCAMPVAQEGEKVVTMRRANKT